MEDTEMDGAAEDLAERGEQGEVETAVNKIYGASAGGSKTIVVRKNEAYETCT